MTFEGLVNEFAPRGEFQLDDVLAFAEKINPEGTQNNRATVLQALHRWKAQGKVHRLRRGLYALPAKIIRTRGIEAAPPAERLANLIRPDAYVTGLWWMHQLGLIPETPTVVTSATRGNLLIVENAHGRFEFRHLTARGFFGFKIFRMGTFDVRAALPEKALLDFFWWKINDGFEWKDNEFERWRIGQQFTRIDLQRMRRYAQKWGDKRLIAAATTFARWVE